jgi:hypothetical protein
MNSMTPEQHKALQLAVSIILECADEAGPMGAPSGVVYAALNAHGMTLLTYNSIIQSLVALKHIEVRNHCIHRVHTQEVAAQ